MPNKTTPYDCQAQRSHNFYKSLRVSISTPAQYVSADWGKFADASPAHSMALTSESKKLTLHAVVYYYCVECQFFRLRRYLRIFAFNAEGSTIWLHYIPTINTKIFSQS